ncbi:MAG: TonB family protein [Acidobacteria bacterium]|nr:TonB family protein [Acidobacteriota bacterium]
MRPVLTGFFTVILLLLCPSQDGAAHASMFKSHALSQPQTAAQKKRAKRRATSKKKSKYAASDIPPMRRGAPTVIGIGSSYPNPLALVVTVNESRRVLLNQEDAGTLSDLGALRARLEKIFEQRRENNILRIGTTEVEKTVIVETSSYLNEEELAKVVGEVKAAGASPVRVMTEAEIQAGTYNPPIEVVSSETRPSPALKQPIAGGVLNGKAISLPKPAYPAVAKAAKASGTVVVQVIIDEEGSVISADAVSGPPLLRASAVQAARQARFSPTLLSGQPVKVAGVINYNFVLQ